MLHDEAVLIGKWAQQLGLNHGSVCLNLGSSTREFRERTQPFIHSEILGPLASNGCRIINCDLKEDDGVDEVGDLLDRSFQERLIGYNADLVICSNLLEHLQSPERFVDACALITKPGGHCIITVPRSFPYHPDPIDTMYRPSCDDLSRLLPDWDVVDRQELAAGSFLDDVSRSPSPARSLARQVIRSLMPFYRPRKWYPEAHKLLWLFRPYKVSLVMLRKPASV